jgi:hydroxyacylglutathione hydrolase
MPGVRMQLTVVPIALGFVSAFLIRGKKDILIDAGTAGAGGRLLAALKRLGVDPGRLALLVITHGHGDHYGGARELLADLSCQIAVHEGDADALRGGRSPHGSPVGFGMRLLMRAGSRMVSASLPRIEPGLVLSGTLDLRPYGIEGTVEHTPGHTPGSVSVFLANGEVVVGDLLRGSMLSSGSPRWPFVAQDLAEAKRSVGRVLDRLPSRIWTSHGGPLAPDAVREFISKDRIAR